MKFFNLKILVSVVFVSAMGMAACNSNNGKVVETETEVLSVDTVGAETTYDVNRKTVESVDTVGATTEYDVEKKVVKRTVEIDTITRELSPADSQDYAQGDYEVIDEKVEEEQETEEVEIGS